jgi:hypothetical protein
MTRQFPHQEFSHLDCLPLDGDVQISPIGLEVPPVSGSVVRGILFATPASLAIWGLIGLCATKLV